jgi:general stress protein YciG
VTRYIITTLRHGKATTIKSHGLKPGSSRRIIAARENGSEGGRKRASVYSGDVLSEWSSRGGKAVLAKYGPNYFTELRKRRKNYPKQNESPVIRPNWRKIMAWENGQKGGLARAARYSHEHFREWGRLGGIETLVRHGKKFYQDIRKKRKHYKKGYLTRKTKMRLRKKCERDARKAIKEENPAIAELWKSAAKQLAT